MWNVGERLMMVENNKWQTVEKSHKLWKTSVTVRWEFFFPKFCFKDDFWWDDFFKIENLINACILKNDFEGWLRNNFKKSKGN